MRRGLTVALMLNGDRIVGDGLSETGSVASAEPGRSGVQDASDASGTGNPLTVAAVKIPTSTIKTIKTPMDNSGSVGNRNDPKNVINCNDGAYDHRVCFSLKGVK